MRTIYFGFISLIICGLLYTSCSKPAGSGQVETTTDLREGFKNPSGTARAKVYWWWMNGYTDSTRIKAELQAIKNAGLGGVDIFEIGFKPDGLVPAGPPFMSDSSLKHIVLAIKEATRLGLEVGLNLASSWNAGGTWIEPKYGAKSLYFSKTKLSARDKTKLPFPEISKKDEKGKVREIAYAADGKPVYYEEVTVLAIPANRQGQYLDTASIINISKFFDPKNEVLSWNAPAGDWDIYRYVCASSGEMLKLPSPNSKGLIIDHFDSTATRVHFEYFIQKLRPLLGDFSKTTLKNLYLASFEATGTIWTPSMASQFRKLNGYDVSKFLPALFDKKAFSPDSYDTFKKDFDFTISELMINNHYRKGKEIANSYGLNLISESGGPGPPLHNVPVEGIKALGALDVPRGEFWINHSQYDATPDSIDLLMLVKEIAAASHIYQRKITELEAFTSFQNWQEGPGDMKPNGDRAFCEGMNRPVIHGFSHNPAGVGYPGIYYVAGTHFNDKTTWWPKVKPFNDYLARVSYILQETDFVADVLYYYGDQVPNFVTPKNTRFAVGSGYDYEVINSEILIRDLTVKNGLLTLPYGAQFKVLALGPISGRNPAVLRKLQQLLKDGARITGIKPTGVTPQSKQLIDQLWEKASIRQNAVHTGPPLEILKSMNLEPDFDYPDKLSARLDYMHKSQPALDYIHYRKGDQDFYFVRNTSKEWISRLCAFRQSGKSPEIWNPETGTISPVKIYNQSTGNISIPLTFPPYSSFFVVFNKNNSGEHYSSLSATGHPPLLEHASDGVRLLQKGSFKLEGNGKSQTVESTPDSTVVSGPWNISFTKGWGAPEKAVFPELISWTQSETPGIKHYSGSGMYDKTFSYNLKTQENDRVYLDLGEVAKVTEVWLNGKSLGIAWTKPYRFDVTGLIKQGQNDLRVEVINTWSNRIIGDIGSQEKFTKTNLNARGSRELLWTETPLVPSGLMGPVVLKTVKVIK
ncbi:glycosyl hydrolase [Dyadobacter bucti]|uniref:glycosyl hydrolase n=1 Tax=Dyadobacter bucti TaxID=2572203 RepID=UPI001108E9E1|nr:glycosyl hydrolase [Dyadobacter bucti]